MFWIFRYFSLLYGASILLTNLGSCAADLTYRWRSLQQQAGTGCSSLLRPELNIHVNEALIDILMFLWSGTNSSTVSEICSSSLRLTESAFLESNVNNVCLSPHSSSEVHFVQSYHRLMNIGSQMKAMGAVPALMNYQDLSSATMRGYFEQSYAPVLTSGPSQTELAEAVYRLAVQSGWSYMLIMTEAEDGAMRLAQALNDMSKRDQRACFPLTITFTASNATQAAKSLKDFAYPRMTRLTVVYAGSGTTFLTLWDLLTGSDSTFSDSEKRFQFVLVGDAFGSFHKATDSSRRSHFGLGTIFVFPGVLDPNPATDQMARLLYNISSSPASMGAFSSLDDTRSRLQSLKTFTSSSCSWRDLSDMCYFQAVMYDYQVLSFLPLSTLSAAVDPSLLNFDSLRQTSVSLSAMSSKFLFVDSFVNQNFTSYSLGQGLIHRDRGPWQPIVKVYQSQLGPGSVATQMKLGELRILQAGTAGQSYEWDLSRTPVFYQFPGGNPDNLPVTASNTGSVCPGSCPECALANGNQYVEYRQGDLYIGAILPMFNRQTDLYKCSDGTFYTSTEWSTAFKFVLQLTNWISEGATLPPIGLDPALLDQQFLLGLKDLVSRVQQGRLKRLNWGYVILDSCYAAPYLTRQLGLLLEGKLEPLIGINYTRFAGFVGDLSSTQTMAASQVLKQYSLPIISHGSTSTALSDVFQYPFTMRTVASDNEIVEAMVSIIKYYKVDLITVVHTPNAYGLSLRSAMLSKASRDRICIAQLLVFNCGFSDNLCKRSLALQIRNAGPRYVAFLSDGSDIGNFLNYPQIEGDLEYITLFSTETISGSYFAGKSNLGVGTTMVQLVSAPEPAFLKFLNYTLSRLPSNSNNLSQWDRLYFEMVHQCHLTDSFVRSGTYTQPCQAGIVASHTVTQLESRTVFLMTAAETLILGSLTAIKYLCSVVTPEPACPAFFKGDTDTQLQRANLIMYGQVTATGTTAQRFSGTFEGSQWSFQKIFENRMGRTPMRLLQFRKIGSVDYDFVQFGLFNGVNSSEFNTTAEQLYNFERQGTSSLVTVCRTAAECGNPKCVNSMAVPDSSGGDTGSRLSYLGLLVFLLPLGVLIGSLVSHQRQKCQGNQEPNRDEDSGYADPDRIGFDNVAMSQAATAESSYYNPSGESDQM